MMTTILYHCQDTSYLCTCFFAQFWKNHNEHTEVVANSNSIFFNPFPYWLWLFFILNRSTKLVRGAIENNCFEAKSLRIFNNYSHPFCIYLDTEVQRLYPKLKISFETLFIQKKKKKSLLCDMLHVHLKLHSLFNILAQICTPALPGIRLNRTLQCAVAYTILS